MLVFLFSFAPIDFDIEQHIQESGEWVCAESDTVCADTSLRV